MVRVTMNRFIGGGKVYYEYSGLSTDTKPSEEQMITGCLFLEVDTGDVYAYDEVGKEWHKIASLGGDS